MMELRPSITLTAEPLCPETPGFPLTKNLALTILKSSVNGRVGTGVRKINAQNQTMALIMMPSERSLINSQADCKMCCFDMTNRRFLKFFLSKDN